MNIGVNAVSFLSSSVFLAGILSQNDRDCVASGVLLSETSCIGEFVHFLHVAL